MPSFTEKQLDMTVPREQVEHRGLRKRLVDSIKTMRANRQAVSAYNSAQKDFKEALEELPIEVPETGVDVLLDEGLVIRRRPSHMSKRKAVPAKDIVRDTIWSTEATQ